MISPEDLGLGATGQFPGGKVSPHDEGELKLAVAADLEKKVVMIHFGKSVTWLGLDAPTTRSFITVLETKLKEIEASKKQPPWTTFQNPTCRGSLRLGNACGTCEKCVWERTHS